jgi:hypothetical protein
MSNLELADLRGRSSPAFVSVSPENRHIGISQEGADRLNAEHKDRFLLAFDEKKRPWVGALPLLEASGEGVSIYRTEGGGTSCQSKALQAKLRRFIEDGERTRLYFTPETETIEISGTGVEMHRLITPEE